MKLTVELGERSYPIFLGTGLEGLEKYVRNRRCLVVTDSNVAERYLAQVFQRIQEASPQSLKTIAFEAGERSKNIETIALLCRTAASAGLDRKSLIVALGGGVAGDMAGFAAAIYMRGIDFIQIPTTLLAMVDSSVGGKTGVDIPEGKNLIGTFHQPKAVFIDPDYLDTLPYDQFRCGLAEIIKTAAILDAEFFAELERNSDKMTAKDRTFTEWMIQKSCEWKAKIVAEDEKESSRRAILNYGHTFGHALENRSGYAMLHGDGVAAGMRLASAFAVRKGILAGTEAERLNRLLDACHFPECPVGNAEEVLDVMIHDKKTLSGKLNLVLTPKLGEAEVVPAERDEVLEFLRGYTR